MYATIIYFFRTDKEEDKSYVKIAAFLILTVFLTIE